MAQIAEAAGVAVQTVYFTFHTKAAVLSRAYDFAVMGEGEPQVPWEQPWYREMVAADDVVEALRQLVSGVGDITRRLTPLYVVASGSAAGDPEVADVVDRHERWRVDGYRGMVDGPAGQVAAAGRSDPGAGQRPAAALRGDGRLPRPRGGRGLVP